MTWILYCRICKKNQKPVTRFNINNPSHFIINCHNSRDTKDIEAYFRDPDGTETLVNTGFYYNEYNLPYRRIYY